MEAVSNDARAAGGTLRETAPRKAPPGFAAVNFFLADVAGGLGPFLPTWFAEALHWSPEGIGLLMTLGGVFGLAFNTPGGALVDRLGRPKLMVMAGSALILLGVATMVIGHALPFVVAGEIIQAVGAAVVGPAMAAATLGYVGRQHFPSQQGRNAAWSNAGNVSAALLVFLGAKRFGANMPLLVLAGMATLTLVALMLLRPPSGAIARMGLAAGSKPMGWRDFVRQRPIFIFALTLMFFHLGNAAMLPLLGLRLAHFGGQGAAGNATRWMSICVIVSQIAMIAVALVVGRLAERYGRIPLLIGACAILPVRAGIAAFGIAPVWLFPIEILDAMGAGTLGVITPPLAADLSWGSGRTQTVLGFVMTVQGIGASLSNALGGTLIGLIGWKLAFLGLGIPPLIALGLAFTLRRITLTVSPRSGPTSPVPDARR
ncbi:MFS transporter [Acidiphilium iwatense]|uniref:MFS transporter n=1 Tax=Acidiphilium iwatense TaxID=768198 RepID=A0ABS9DRX6_9PROT|nr:MFS transporter [Acidiphilium iwatense]MCF3945496.1 MFS transporter [Acidiphilium iwatense]